MTADRASLLHRCRRGQALAEFALVVPVLIAVVGAIIQFGMVFWGQVTLTQVVRDTGRWAATQQACTAGTDSGKVDVAKTANTFALSSSLFAYNDGEWAAPYELVDSSQWKTSSPGLMTVSWADTTDPASDAPTCPPPDNQQVWNVTVSAQHTIPVFLPGAQYLPGFEDNQVTLSSTAVFRVEPRPVP